MLLAHIPDYRFYTQKTWSDMSTIPVPSLQEIFLSLITSYSLERLAEENISAKVPVGEDHGGHKGPDVKRQTQPA